MPAVRRSETRYQPVRSGWRQKLCQMSCYAWDPFLNGVTIHNVMGIIGSYKIRHGNRVSLLASMHTTRFQLAVFLTGAHDLFKLQKLDGPLTSNTCKQRMRYGLEGSWWRPSTSTFTNIRLTYMNVWRTICLSVKSVECSYSCSLNHNKIKKLTNQPTNWPTT